MILALMCMIAPSVFAQNSAEETSVKKSCPFALDFNFNGTTENKGKQFLNSSVRLSYTPAWRLGVVGEVGSNLMLSDVNGNKDWDDALTLGGGLTFRLGDLLLDADTKQYLRFKIFCRHDGYACVIVSVVIRSITDGATHCCCNLET